MTSPLVLGIDLGLSGARAAVMDADGAVLSASGHYGVRASLAPGRAEQDPLEWLTAVAEAGRAAAAGRGQQVDAIAISALGPAPVLVSADLAPLTPALLFSLDTRAEQCRRALADQLGLTADQLNHDHAIPKLLWWRDNEPELWQQAAWALDATGFLVSHLTNIPTMDSITACDYSLPGLACPVTLPAPLDPLSVAGPLTAWWADRLGLRPGIPVLAGTYDSYADSAATGTVRVGDGCIIFGSTLIIGAVREAAPADMNGLLAAPHLGDGVLVGGWTATGCSALEWASRVLGADQASGGSLAESAGGIPAGADGLIFLPYLAGERSPVHDPYARGVLLGLTSTTTQAAIYRAVVDGLALSVRDHAQRLASIGASPRRWRASGGGTRNRLLMQAASDALGAPLEVITWASEPVGPCRMALRGIGRDPAVDVAEAFQPDARGIAYFDQLYDIYKTIYRSLSDQMHALTDFGLAHGGTR